MDNKNKIEVGHSVILDPALGYREGLAEGVVVFIQDEEIIVSFHEGGTRWLEICSKFELKIV